MPENESLSLNDLLNSCSWEDVQDAFEDSPASRNMPDGSYIGKLASVEFSTYKPEENSPKSYPRASLVFEVVQSLEDEKLVGRKIYANLFLGPGKNEKNPSSKASSGWTTVKGIINDLTGSTDMDEKAMLKFLSEDAIETSWELDLNTNVSKKGKSKGKKFQNVNIGHLVQN